MNQRNTEEIVKTTEKRKHVNLWSKWNPPQYFLKEKNMIKNKIVDLKFFVKRLAKIIIIVKKI